MEAISQVWPSQTHRASSTCCASLLIETGSWRKERWGRSNSLFQDELRASTKIIKDQFEIRFVNHTNLLLKSKNTNVELEIGITGDC